MNNAIFCLFLAAAVTVSGCRNKTAPSPTTPTHPPAPVVLATPQQAATGTPVTGPEAEAINRALAMSAPVSGFPTDLSVLLDGKSVAKIPTPPPGKKLAIDQVKMRLILLNE